MSIKKSTKGLKSELSRKYRYETFENEINEYELKIEEVKKWSKENEKKIRKYMSKLWEYYFKNSLNDISNKPKLEMNYIHFKDIGLTKDESPYNCFVIKEIIMKNKNFFVDENKNDIINFLKFIFLENILVIRFELNKNKDDMFECQNNSISKENLEKINYCYEDSKAGTGSKVKGVYEKLIVNELIKEIEHNNCFIIDVERLKYFVERENEKKLKFLLDKASQLTNKFEKIEKSASLQDKKVRKIKNNIDNFNRDIMVIMTLFIAAIGFVTTNTSVYKMIEKYSLGRQLFTILVSNFSLVYIIFTIFVCIDHVVSFNNKSSIKNSWFNMTLIMAIFAILAFLLGTIGIEFSMDL